MVIVVLVHGLINEDLKNAVLVTKQSEIGGEVLVIATCCVSGTGLFASF